MFRIALLLLCVCLACKGTQQQDFYKIEAPPVVLKRGSEGPVSLRFAGIGKYHWNEEYPAKLEIKEADHLQTQKKVFRASEGDFKVQDGVAILEFQTKADSDGPQARMIRATADFSVCAEKECRIFKGVAVEVRVDVR